MRKLLLKYLQMTHLDHFTEFLRLAVKWLLFYWLCRGNVPRYLRMRAALAHIIASLGLYERQNIRLLKNFIKPGDTVVDIGASFGVYTVAMARLVGPQGRVIAFEPLPEVFALLKEKTASFPNVEAHNLGVSNEAKSGCKFNVPLLFGKIPEPALASLHSPTRKFTSILVEVRTLDSFMAGARSVSFIKIDAESHELTILEGARETLKKFRPVVQLEQNELAVTYESLMKFAHVLKFSIACGTAGGGIKPVMATCLTSYRDIYLIPA